MLAPPKSSACFVCLLIDLAVPLDATIAALICAACAELRTCSASKLADVVVGCCFLLVAGLLVADVVVVLVVAVVVVEVALGAAVRLPETVWRALSFSTALLAACSCGGACFLMSVLAIVVEFTVVVIVELLVELFTCTCKALFVEPRVGLPDAGESGGRKASPPLITDLSLNELEEGSRESSPLE